MTVVMEHMEQGSQEWHDARCGRITMSNAKKLITGGKGATRTTYLIEVASEILTGIPAESISTWDMARGSALEPYALEAYKSQTGREVRQVGLGYLDDMKRIAASPDALWTSGTGGTEIKCQKVKKHMQTIVEMKNPKQFEAQMQGCMWVFGVEEWDYCSFCPEFKAMPLVVISKKRDEEIIKRISDSAHLGLEEIDKYVEMASGKINEEIKLICRDALDLLDVLNDREVDIL